MLRCYDNSGVDYCEFDEDVDANAEDEDEVDDEEKDPAVSHLPRRPHSTLHRLPCIADLHRSALFSHILYRPTLHRLALHRLAFHRPTLHRSTLHRTTL